MSLVCLLLGGWDCVGSDRHTKSTGHLVPYLLSLFPFSFVWVFLNKKIVIMYNNISATVITSTRKRVYDFILQ